MSPPNGRAEERAARTAWKAEIDVPNVGRVRFTVKRSKHKRGKTSHYFWSATKAVVDK
jgi:hypothetical protein